MADTPLSGEARFSGHSLNAEAMDQSPIEDRNHHRAELMTH